MMQAIEFEANPADGIIRIPESHKGWYGKRIKVILLSKTESEPIDTDPGKEALAHFFDQFNADLTGYNFNRDEANER